MNNMEFMSTVSVTLHLDSEEEDSLAFMAAKKRT